MWKPFEPEVFTHDGSDELLEQIAQAERGGAHRSAIVRRRIEIEDADVGVIELRHPRDPDVLRDRVLVGHPQQRSLVGDDRMMDDAVLLRAPRRARASREIPSRRPSARTPSCRCRPDSAPS